MSKRALRAYLSELSKAALQEQLTDLYDRLPEVREFYDFVFNPQETKRLDEAKFKVSKEFFPPANRKAKKRRSVAQEYIKHFQKLGVSPEITADLMLYAIEIAIVYTQDAEIKQEAFYKSMLRSFQEAVAFIAENGLTAQFENRIHKIVVNTAAAKWYNYRAFEAVTED